MNWWCVLAAWMFFGGHLPHLASKKRGQIDQLRDTCKAAHAHVRLQKASLHLKPSQFAPNSMGVAGLERDSAASTLTYGITLS